MVGLLAAVGAAMSALVAYTHGDLTWITIADAALATGLAAYAAAPSKKMLIDMLTAYMKLTHCYVDLADFDTSLYTVLPIGADGLAGQDHCSRVGACAHRFGYATAGSALDCDLGR
jgi:hypothetical protein